MDQKIKILIGVLVVGVVLISGWWIWNSQTGPSPKRGIPGFPRLFPEITITTDKTEYEQGGTVRITVENNLDESIWYRGSPNICKNAFSIGVKEENYKEFYTFATAYCITDPVELKAHSKAIFELDLDENFNHWLTNNNLKIPGTYKLEFNYGYNKEDPKEKKSYSDEFTIKGKNEDETADWKAYRNEEYGFKIKYPEDWNLWITEPDEFSPRGDWGEQIGELAIFQSRLEGTPYCEFHLTTYSNPKNLSIRDFWRARLPEVYKIKNSENVIFGKEQISGVRFSMERTDQPLPNESRAVITKRNNNIIELFWWGQKPAVSNPDCLKVEQMLSTFKFLEGKTSGEKPYIQVLSPNGGEKWVQGNTYVISWFSDKSIKKVKIDLVSVDSNAAARNISFGLIVNAGRYTWHIPYCSPGHECSSNFQIPQGKYYIQITNESGTISDQSDAPFSIVFPTE